MSLGFTDFGQIELLGSSPEPTFLPPLPCSGEEARAALREGMCPYGHGLEPVRAELVYDWGRGRRMGTCHTCRPCIEYSWPRDDTAPACWGGTGWLFSRGHAHYDGPPPPGHS